MIYTKEKMAAIRAGVQKAGLSAPQEFFDAGIDELCEVCNGVGGSGLSNDSRLKLTRAFSFINRTIWTNLFTLSTFDTFFLVDIRISILKTNCLLRTNFHTRMGHTSLALLSYNKSLLHTFIPCRWNHLKKWRLIILL